MADNPKHDFGVIGMAVMGRNLAMNLADHGTRVAIYSRNPAHTQDAVKQSGGRLRSTSSLEELVNSLQKPRKILMMIKAGKPVDVVMKQLKPLLDRGDIVIDGGNSWYEDTGRREKNYASVGLKFVGVGISGGEDGARHGPSLMPGGDRQAYKELKPVFEAIAAKTDSGSCVTHVGPYGAGHFVKMVHNGIEYADMQLIAEAYHLLKDVGGLSPEALAEVFSKWNCGPLESFLIQITAKIFSIKDPEDDGYLVDQVLDRAGQKGTGRWAAQVALEYGVAIPTIAAAIDARVLSSQKSERERASKVLGGPRPQRQWGDRKKFVQKVHDALYAAKIIAYTQGLNLIDTVSRENKWDIDMREIARIWKGGCIIRARFLDTIMMAYTHNAKLSSLLLDKGINQEIESRQGAWREVVCLAQKNGIPVSGMATGVAYYDSYRSTDLPQNLTQAQRDAFGTHAYQRKGDTNEQWIHTDWLGPGV